VEEEEEEERERRYGSTEVQGLELGCSGRERRSAKRKGITRGK